MSDFDKEAEREKLREKYERDEEKRETTEQMSELLLKGATMTNAHCGDCGDPVFRYDGQEFCPTCEKPIDRGTADGAADAESGETSGSGEPATRNGDAGDGIEVTKPSDDATVQFGSDAAGAEAQRAADRARDASQDRSAGSPGNASDQPSDETERTRQVPSAAPSSGSASDPTTGSANAPSAGDGASDSVREHLDEAQRLLAQTVERHATLAASADSPRETRDHLETAREAARTLDATGY